MNPSSEIAEAKTVSHPRRKRSFVSRLRRWALLALVSVVLLTLASWNTDLGVKRILPGLVLLAAPGAPTAATPATPAPAVFDAVKFGATPDDDRLDTEAIQAAIQACAAAGGGDVRVAGGEFRAGQLQLADRVTLVIEAGAVLRASRTRADFPGAVWIRAVGVTNAGVRGPGRLIGNGSAFFNVSLANILAWTKRGSPTGAVKHPVEVVGIPFTHLMQFADCRQVKVERIAIEDSPSWTIHALACDGVRIEGVTISNVVYGPYTDGIDVDCSSHVLVKDCVVTAGDDAYCVKSTNHKGLRRPACDIVFENCLARSPTNGYKIGTETQDDISDVTFRNCRVEPPLPGVTPLAGLNISTVDGGRLRRVTAEKMTMTSVRCPVFIRLGNRGKGVPPEKRAPGVLDGVTISDLIVEQCRQPITIAGLNGHPVQNVRLERIVVRRQTGEFAPRALEQIPELPAGYPEAPMFGMLPCTGLFARHCAGLALQAVTMHRPSDSLVPALVTTSVTGLEGDIVGSQ